jgi:hypothetical protein
MSGESMALFESKEVKQARRQVAIRMGKKKVAQYVGDCQRMSAKYTDLAKKALALGRQGQCNSYLCRRLRYDEQSEKWQAFLLHMEDLSLRGQMSGAMTGLVKGMQALNQEIQAGVSVKDMTRAVTDLNLTMTQLEQTEEQLGVIMEGLDFEVGVPMADGDSSSIPADLQDRVNLLRNEIMDEVVVEEKVGASPRGRGAAGKVPSEDKRIQGGLERVRKLKKK